LIIFALRGIAIRSYVTTIPLATARVSRLRQDVVMLEYTQVIA
jgi:hypothetical protein